MGGRRCSSSRKQVLIFGERYHCYQQSGTVLRSLGMSEKPTLACPIETVAKRQIFLLTLSLAVLNWVQHFVMLQVLYNYSEKPILECPLETVAKWQIFLLRLSLAVLNRQSKPVFVIGNRKDIICLQMYGQVSGQPKRCRSAMLVIFQVLHIQENQYWHALQRQQQSGKFAY